MTSSFINLLLYGGLDEETYNKYKQNILDQDMKNLTFYLLVTTLGFFSLGLANMLTAAWEAANTQVYFMTMMINVVILTVQQMVVRTGKDWPVFKSALVYIYTGAIYFIAILLTVQHPDMPSVTFICTLLMLPILFARRPVDTIVMQIVFTAIFCYCVSIYKVDAMISNDIWNGITFCAFSIVTLLIVVPVRIREQAQTQTIRIMSQYDLLTGIKNRNSYEAACDDWADHPESKMVVYMDVNGLHELNDTKGHTAGDIMLRDVAGIIKDAFGEDCTYRIGGDEFVVISSDANLRSIKEAISQVNQRVTAAGYSVSIGYARSLGPDEPYTAVIQRAETEMYNAKARYYQATGKNRRRI